MRRQRTIVGILCLAMLASAAGVASRLAAAGDPAVRTVAMETSPWAVALDPATDHALVVTRPPINRGLGGTNPAGFPAAADGTVSVVDIPSGKVLRTVSLAASPRAVAVDQAAGRAFVATLDNRVDVLDTRGGALLGTLDVGLLPRAIAVDPRTHRAFVVNSGDGTVSVLDTRQASVLRTVHVASDAAAGYDGAIRLSPGTTGGGLQAPGAGGTAYGYGGFAFGYFQQRSAAVDEPTHRVFIGGAGGVSVLDAGTGALLQTIALPSYGSYLAVDAGTGQVYVAGSNGVSVLDGRTGEVLRILAAGGPASAVAVDSRRHRVYVVHGGAVYSRGVHSGPGTVSVLDAGTGAVLRTLPVGVAPAAVAVDENTGRAVVVNAGGRVQAHDAWTWVPASLQRWVPFHPQQATGARWVAGSLSILNAGS